ncbi:DUF4976 domain-containing protein [Chitinophaga silvatica]|uniref:DUF4976 domain-containing protein n=1 Tax=Chitinophaga silvatica TaxID=2282649 RepID=A0A3E1Y5I3_9BACT|nr:sulfatase [Chitinophaga silvatica]RFS19998.1 DUF4976 domain-containing protein [Chitinophaga silvatica]
MKNSLLFFVFLLMAHSVKAQKKPNIIVIMTDDHALQSISAYNPSLIHTPNIDRIAIEGAIFTNSFCTNSICAPSRAVILTGKHSNVNGQIHNGITFDSSQVTFPKLLQAAGYQTALVGKWHLKSTPTGFNYWITMPDQGHYYNPDFIHMDGSIERVEGYATNLITDYALRYMEHRDTSKPFCMLLYHKAPHRNWMPDTSNFNDFRGRKFKAPATLFDSYENRTAAAQQEMSIEKDMYLVYDLKLYDTSGIIQDGKWSWTNFIHDYDRLNPAQKAAWDKEYAPVIEDYKQKLPTGKALVAWKYQRYMEDYLRCIKSVDQNIGRVLKYLDDHHLTENTIVIYTSDQGMYLGEHGWFDKRFMYEESLHMPLVMRYPGHIKPGTVEKHLVQNLDYAPTLLQYAGVSAPVEMQGESFAPLLAGQQIPWRDAIYYHYYEYPAFHSVKRHYGIRTNRYKLIHFYNDIDSWELYDLIKDPHEMKNVYNATSYKAIREELIIKLETLKTKYKDTIPDNFVRPF